MSNELEEIRKRRLQEYKNKFMSGGKKNMSENMPDKPLEITDADFDNTVKKYDTIVVDCWAPWCGPCRMVGPVIDELAKEMQGEIVFGKLNVDENPNISSRHNIMSIPTLLIFKKGRLVDQLIGAIPKEQLKQKLASY
jgi:thioredoxin 1